MLCFIYASVLFIQTMFTERMTSDDCLWLEMVDGKKLEDALYITQVLPGGNTEQAGIKNGDILIELGGKKFKNSLEAQKILNSYDSGEMIKYKVLRGTSVIETEVKVYKIFNIIFLIFSLLGYGFLFIGHLVGFSKPRELTSQLFFFLGCSAVCGLGTVGQINVPFMMNPLLTISTLGTALFFPLFLHFFMTYPLKIEFKHRTGFLIFIYVFSFSAAFIPRILGFIDVRIARTTYIYPLVYSTYIIAGLVFLVSSYRKITDETKRKPLRVILYGFGLAAIGFAYGLLLPAFASKPDFLIRPWLYIPTSLVLAIPISFGFSIVKYRILDTEFLIKKGLVFGIITAFIVGIYLLLVLVLDSLLGQLIPENKQIITIAMIVIVTFSFDFVNNKAKEFVDKQLYRERYNYRKSLLKFSEELPYLGSMKQIMERLGTSIKETMGISTLNVWFRDQGLYKTLMEEYSAAGDKKRVLDLGSQFNDALSALFEKDHEAKLLDEIFLYEHRLSQQAKEILKKENYTLSVPIHIKDELVGALNFGPKPSGKAYSEEDIDLLKTLASQAAIAFENSRLQREKISKQKMEEELHIARKIQMGLLPQAIDGIRGIEISGFYNPARQIGGDFYDVIKLSESKMLVVVADVSGKGIPAAIYMSKVQAMIQFASKVFPSPKEILIEVNKQIHQKIDRKSFITSVVALFDMNERKVRICRAGHNPVIYSLNGRFEFLMSKGLGLGLDSNHYFEDVLEEVELPVSQDSMFIFYSDGLTEAMNQSREEFGTAKVFEIVSKNRGLPCAEIQKELIDSVTEFRGGAEQNDDITLVVARVRNTAFSET